MLFAEMSPIAEWAYLVTAIAGLASVVLGFISAVFSIWAKSRADAAANLVVTTTAEAKVERAHVAQVALVAATEVKQKVDVAVAKVETAAEVVTEIAGKQDEQHKLMNSGLDELKRVIATAKLAEGKLLGRAELQAEIDAKTVAAAQGAKLAAQPGTVTVPNAQAVLTGIATEVVAQIAKASEDNKQDAKKEQIPVTLPPAPLKGTHP